MIVELGCGVGRTVRDVARAMPEATVLGFDISPDMLAVARSLLNGGGSLAVDLSDRGFDLVRMPSVVLPNVSFRELAEDGDLPPNAPLGRSHVVISLNAIERVSNPDRHLRAAASLLADEGFLVLASSLNWTSAASWRRFPTFAALLEYVVDAAGLRIDTAIEDLPYFETMDRNGAGETFKVSTAVLRRTG